MLLCERKHICNLLQMCFLNVELFAFCVENVYNINILYFNRSHFGIDREFF